MLKSKKNIFIIFAILVMLIIQLLTTSVYATGKGGGTKNPDLLENLEDFRPSQITNEDAIMNKAGVILGAINLVGTIVSVITIMIIGFKYMLGSAEDKASYKKTMIPWLIGAVLVFTVSALPNILYNIGSELL